MSEIAMTPENRPYFDALMRILALGRNADAEDKIVEAIQELMDRRAEVAAMRPIVEAVARIGQDAFGEPANGPWIWTCPMCHQKIGGEVMQFGNATIGDHVDNCPVPQALAIVNAGEQVEC